MSFCFALSGVKLTVQVEIPQDVSANFVAWLPSTPSKLGTLFIESFSKVFGVTWCFACLLKPHLSLHNYKGSFEISAFDF